MALPAFPQSQSDYVEGLEDADFLNGGHRTNFIPSLIAALAFAVYGKDAATEVQAIADQVATDAASAAAGSGTEVTVEQIWVGAAAQYLSIRRALASQAPVATAFASTLTLDLEAGTNFDVAALTGNLLLGNPSNPVVNKSGFILFTQDATGGRTITKGSNWEIAGGEIIIDQAPNAVSMLTYFVKSETRILGTVASYFA